MIRLDKDGFQGCCFFSMIVMTFFVFSAWVMAPIWLKMFRAVFRRSNAF